MGLGDFFNGSTLGGFLSGGGPGAVSGYFQHQATKAKKSAVGQARLKLEELARTQRAQRVADLNKTMSYFSPVQDEMTRLYGRR